MRMGAIAANRRRTVSTWTPADYFTGGVDGAYWDASDLSTMFQNSIGTTAVTTSGDPVGYMADKSGNGYHLIRPTSDTWRPVYTTGGGAGGTSPYLDFDGASSALTISPSFAAKSQPHFIGIAAKIDTTGADAALCDGVAVGQRALMNRNSTNGFALNAGSAGLTGLTATTNDAVYMGFFSGASSVGHIDNSSATVNAGTNQITSIQFGADRLSGSVVDGRFYAMIWIPGTPDATLLANIRTWLASKQGRTL